MENAVAWSVCTYRIHARFFEMGNCLDITIMFDMLMTSAPLQEYVIELRQQGLTDADSALQLIPIFCSALTFSSAHPVVRRRRHNETRSSTHLLIGRLRSIPLLVTFRYDRVSGLFSHSRIVLQQLRHAGENL